MHKLMQRRNNIGGMRRARSRRRKQNDVMSCTRKSACTSGLPQYALRAVARNSIPDALRCSEGDPPWIAFLQCITYNQSYYGMVIVPSLFVDTLEI